MEQGSRMNRPTGARPEVRRAKCRRGEVSQIPQIDDRPIRRSADSTFPSPQAARRNSRGESTVRDGQCLSAYRLKKKEKGAPGTGTPFLDFFEVPVADGVAGLPPSTFTRASRSRLFAQLAVSLDCRPHLHEGKPFAAVTGGFPAVTKAADRYSSSATWKALSNPLTKTISTCSFSPALATLLWQPPQQ